MSSFQENHIMDILLEKLKEFLDEFSIDNQLLDYIMIMIRNEATREQMAEDLTPFMGERATVFAAWLDEKLKSSFVSNLPQVESDASSEELDIKIDENEFIDDMDPSNEESRNLKHRSFADAKLEKIRAKRRLDEQLDGDSNNKRNRRKSKKSRKGDVRFVNKDADKISNRVKKNEYISKRKVFQIVTEAENIIKDKKYFESSKADDQEMNVDIENEIIMKNRLIKCSFWPLCEKNDECTFLHPSKPCIMFPNCQYGQKCRYIHPQCRYDGFCSRADCPYTHLTPKNSHLQSEEALNEEEIANERTSLNDPKTKASNNATSTLFENSKYLYPLSNQYNLANNRYNTIPIYCKFDSLCINPNCSYIHFNSLPHNENRMKMKWKATNSHAAQNQDDSKMENLTSKNENSLA